MPIPISSYLSRLSRVPRRQLAYGDAALQPIARVGADVVALLEALRELAALDGSAGLNRLPAPTRQAPLGIDVTNDRT
ncbi:hypothetical protein [Burkholderia gladioli]|uniref:hypothetical protein n=1 Tax=Burkholderia gladioli TaxID=28095 RepID=UPI0016416D39|nr:hypothetical protein [Burkholderia gladioli]